MIPTEWIRDLLLLKRIPRAGWFLVGVDRPESVADHSFAMAMVAWRIAREAPGLDAGRVLLMSLLHDFAEARLTDIPNPAKQLLPEGAFEEAEAGVIREQWRDDEEAQSLLAEFLAGETEEAKLVAAVDHLELVLQAAAYREAGHPMAARMLIRAREGPAMRHPLTRSYAEPLVRDAG